MSLGARLPDARYLDHQKPKEVHYWIGTVRDDEGFAPDEEVDAITWVPVPEATEFLTYSRGGLVSCAIGALVYVVFAADPSKLLGALTALVGAGAGLAVVAGPDAFSSRAKLTGSGLAQGHRAAWLLLWISLAVCLLRAGLCLLERRTLLAPRPPRLAP